MVCDNLALPFRDESFDAVLSIAVVHHFATTERRVGALRELARVLRIGGRLVITVWAMEQRHRKVRHKYRPVERQAVFPLYDVGVGRWGTSKTTTSVVEGVGGFSTSFSPECYLFPSPPVNRCPKFAESMK